MYANNTAMVMEASNVLQIDVLCNRYKKPGQLKRMQVFASCIGIR